MSIWKVIILKTVKVHFKKGCLFHVQSFLDMMTERDY